MVCCCSYAFFASTSPLLLAKLQKFQTEWKKLFVLYATDDDDADTDAVADSEGGGVSAIFAVVCNVK